MMTGLVIAAALALAGGCGLVFLARRPGAAGIQATAGAGVAAELPVALVSFVLAGGAAGREAYEATILDLAARGFLAASTGRDGLRLSVVDGAAFPSPGSDLTGYEGQALNDAQARLSGTEGAPIEVVADACRVDVRGVWDPFEAKLRADARRRGLCQPRLPVTTQTVAVSLAATAGIAASAFLVARLVAVQSNPHPGDGWPAVVGVLAMLIFWGVLGWLARHDTLTAHGSALAARWRRDRAAFAADAASRRRPGRPDADPADLRRAAFATASGLPRGIPAFRMSGRHRRVRARIGRPNASDRPSEAWSSFSGTWRAVEIRVGLGLGMGRGFALLGGAAWAALIAYAVSIPSGTGPLPLMMACLSAGLAVVGVRVLARLYAMPSRAIFDGQVIARWQEDDSSENGSGRTRCIAVDDGRRAWTFTGSAVFGRVALGDLVRVTVNPRSGRLLELLVTSRPRPAGADAVAEAAAARRSAEPLLTIAEAAELVGPAVRNTPVPGPGGHSMIVKGRDGTLSLVVTTGGIASFNVMIGRRAGTRLPGIGDEAWLLNRQRTVVARVGQQLMNLTVNSSGATSNPGRLPAIAALVATLLARQAATVAPDGTTGAAKADTTRPVHWKP